MRIYTQARAWLVGPYYKPDERLSLKIYGKLFIPRNKTAIKLKLQVDGIPLQTESLDIGMVDTNMYLHHVILLKVSHLIPIHLEGSLTPWCWTPSPLPVPAAFVVSQPHVSLHEPHLLEHPIASSSATLHISPLS